jgi:hypothetical protein
LVSSITRRKSAQSSALISRAICSTSYFLDQARRRWLREVRTVAAYRDRYKVEGRRALGAPANEAQKLDAARAEQAIRRARAIAEDTVNAQDGRSRALDARGRAIG